MNVAANWSAFAALKASGSTPLLTRLAAASRYRAVRLSRPGGIITTSVRPPGGPAAPAGSETSAATCPRADSACVSWTTVVRRCLMSSRSRRRIWIASAMPAMQRPKIGNGNAAVRGALDHGGSGGLLRHRDHHGAREVSERVVGEIAAGAGGRDPHLRGHPLDALLDEVGEGGVGRGLGRCEDVDDGLSRGIPIGAVAVNCRVLERPVG